MKSKRHQEILRLIEAYSIDTQEELLSKLNESGFSATQSTVSRDIKELQLIKVQTAGGYRYAVNARKESGDIAFKFHAVFSESVSAIDRAENIVVIKCYVGMANAACAALDSIRWDGMVGTIAGDDTIFCLMRTAEGAIAFAEQLARLLK